MDMSCSLPEPQDGVGSRRAALPRTRAARLAANNKTPEDDR